MNQNDAGHNNLLDTTDCLEAVGVFKGWKNLLFISIFLCLLITQAGFWLVDLGWVQIPSDTTAKSAQDILINIPIVAGTAGNNDMQIEPVELNLAVADINSSSPTGLPALDEANI